MTNEPNTNKMTRRRCMLFVWAEDLNMVLTQKELIFFKKKMMIIFMHVRKIAGHLRSACTVNQNLSETATWPSAIVKYH